MHRTVCDFTGYTRGKYKSKRKVSWDDVDNYFLPKRKNKLNSLQPYNLEP